MDTRLLVSSFPELWSSDMCGDLICASGEMKTHDPIIATGNLPSWIHWPCDCLFPFSHEFFIGNFTMWHRPYEGKHSAFILTFTFCWQFAAAFQLQFISVWCIDFSIHQQAPPHIGYFLKNSYHPGPGIGCFLKFSYWPGPAIGCFINFFLSCFFRMYSLCQKENQPQLQMGVHAQLFLNFSY